MAILASHPIQYQAPLFRKLAAEPQLDVEVFFCSRWGVDRYADPGFGKEISWDVPVLGGYRHRFLKNWRRGGGPSTFLGSINPGIAAVMIRGKFDSVLVHGWGHLTEWMCVAAASSTRVPILLRGEASAVLQPTGLKRVLKRLILAPLFRQVSAFLAIGSNNASFYQTFGIPDSKIFLAPYSVDNGFFFSQADKLKSERGALRAAFGVPDDSPIILYCGKFNPRKRPMDLLKAYLSVESNAWLIFVGDGELRMELERFVSDQGLQRVRFLGFYNQTEISKAYVAADLFVLPSDYETWGLVVNEAMCSGLPIIAGDRVGSAVDLVRNGYNGYTFPSGDVPALAQRLALLLRDNKLRQLMGENSRKLISSWGLDETAAGIVRAALSVAEQRRSDS